MMRAFRKYYGFYLMEYKRVKLYVPDVVVRVILISLRVVMPYSVFSVLEANGLISKETVYSMAWAVLVGQILNGSSMRLHTKIRDEIRTGNISIRLSEPVNYVYAKLFQSFGYFIPTFLTYSILFFSFFAFVFPTDIQVGVLLIYTVLGFLILNMVNIVLGLLSFIVEEIDGLYWITSKLFFVLGNQVIPIALMPVGVVAVAKFTPFYLALAGPIEAASGRLDLVQGAVMSVIYIVALLALAQFMLQKLQKRLILNG
jgi:ABC-type uncharacterized transport system permease subunit